MYSLLKQKFYNDAKTEFMPHQGSFMKTISVKNRLRKHMLNSEMTANSAKTVKDGKNRVVMTHAVNVIKRMESRSATANA